MEGGIMGGVVTGGVVTGGRIMGGGVLGIHDVFLQFFSCSCQIQ